MKINKQKRKKIITDFIKRIVEDISGALFKI